jgi:hypothetical protein
MLNFAERTGSGAVMLVWSFPFNYVEINVSILIIQLDMDVKITMTRADEGSHPCPTVPLMPLRLPMMRRCHRRFLYIPPTQSNQ